MNTYFFSGTCSSFLDSVTDSSFMFFCHGDSRWNAKIQSSTLRSALSLLAKLFGDCDYILNPRYTVVNRFNKESVRLLKDGVRK